MLNIVALQGRLTATPELKRRRTRTMRVSDALQIAELFANGCLRREDFAKAWEIIKADCPELGLIGEPAIDRISRIEFVYIIDRLLMELAPNESNTGEEVKSGNGCVDGGK